LTLAQEISLSSLGKLSSRWGPRLSATDELIAGVARCEAAKLAGISRIPTPRLEHLSPAEVRLLRIADNRLAEQGEWSWPELASEFKELAALEFDLESTAFDVPEIDGILMKNGRRSAADAGLTEPPVPDLPTGDPVTQPGDLWNIGRHRLLCGDAKDAASHQRLMGSLPCELFVTDPPFNVRIRGHVSGLGKVQHREFAMASGERSRQQFIDFLGVVLGHLAAVSGPGSLHYVFIDWRHLDVCRHRFHGEASWSQYGHFGQSGAAWQKGGAV